jgi:hypothetical protein
MSSERSSLQHGMVKWDAAAMSTPFRDPRMSNWCQAAADELRSSPLLRSQVEGRYHASSVDGSHFAAMPLIAYCYIIA